MDPGGCLKAAGLAPEVVGGPAWIHISGAKMEYTGPRRRTVYPNSDYLWAFILRDLSPPERKLIQVLEPFINKKNGACWPGDEKVEILGGFKRDLLRVARNRLIARGLLTTEMKRPICKGKELPQARLHYIFWLPLDPPMTDGTREFIRRERRMHMDFRKRKDTSGPQKATVISSPN